MVKHCLDIENLSDAEIDSILVRAEELCAHYAAHGSYPQTLQGKIAFTAFFEDSTRTRVSFETAALRAGAQIVSLSMKSSSINKGESFSDTVQTLAANKPDTIIMRSGDYKAPHFAAQLTKQIAPECAIINAGDSWRAHPTQALLDALTIRQHKGKDLSGLTIAICGDVAHSRVARSNHALLSRLGLNVRIVAPDYFMPEDKDFVGAARYSDFEDGITGCDLIMMLRIQKERLPDNANNALNETDYAISHGLNAERLDRLAPNALIMHPAPMNRGIEIDDECADDPERSLIFKQMQNGVPARIAVLEHCLL